MPADATTRDKAYYAARSVTRRLGRATAQLRVEPSFLIAGAQRCGTTSLYKTITQHPAVLPAVMHKGVHYFDMHFDRDRSWYLGHFPTRRTLERHGIEGTPAITGESSPYYLFHPQAAGRIAEALPQVKILVLVRDPIERAHSAHAHESARGFETLPFREAIAAEESRTAEDYRRMARDPDFSSFSVQHHSYVARGRYAEQLERMAAAVGRERVHVIDSGRFFTTPEDVMPGLLDFLSLPGYDGFVFERHNARPRAPLPDDLRQQLEQAFRESDQALTQWLGRPASWVS